MTQILISFQEAIEAIESVPEGNWRPSRYIKELEKLDPVQPERKKGKWLDMGDFEQCSVCGGTHLKEFQSYYGKTKWIKTDYCPNCGADMRDISEDPEDACSGCDYYDLEDNNCRVFECFGIDCLRLPCEEQDINGQ